MITNQFVTAAMTRRSNLLLPLALATALSACQKVETVPTTAERLKYVEQKQQTQPDYYVPRKAVDYMSDLKTLKDNTPAPKVAPLESPAKAAEAKQIVAEANSAAPVVAAPAPTPSPAPVQAAPPPAAVAPPANVVASAAPTARPIPPKENPAAITVVSREQPDFPRDAARKGVESGTVRARVMINATGAVSSVVILESKPPRVFDRAVSQALQRWKFNPGADGRSYEAEINFKL